MSDNQGFPKAGDSIGSRNENADYKMLEEVFRNLPSPIFYRDRDLKIRRCNKAFCKFFDLTEDSIFGRTVNECIAPSTAAAIALADEEILSLASISATRDFAFVKDGTESAYSLTDIAVLDANGKLGGIAAIIKDVTSLVESKRKIDRLMRLKDAVLAINRSMLGLADQAQLFDLILEKVLGAIDHANVGCVLLLGEDRTLHIAAARGYPRAELPGFGVKLEDAFQWKHTGGRLEETIIINDLQEFIETHGIPEDILKDENGFEIRSTMSAPIVLDGEFLGLINLDSRENNVFDETDRDLVEYVRFQVPIAIGMFKSYGKIKELLAEKELILREVHHRIKNNMSVMHSILSLQGARIRDAAAKRALEDACDRIHSMTVLYDRLYQAKNFRSVSIAYFLPSLVNEIIENSRGATSIEVETNIDDFDIDPDRLQALGIIVNEILTNSIKYAFKDATKGRIFVRASRERDRARFEIGDDGVGMPASVELGRSTGFGLTLIDELTKQIDGTIRIVRGAGTAFILDFPISG